MKLFKQIHEWVSFRNRLKDSSNIGFVPTMGCLHKGHISLINRAIKENKYAVVSIFLNPTQFDNRNDLIRYPIDINNDLEILKNIGVQYVILPKEKEIYKNSYSYRISEHNYSLKMEGKR